KEYQARESVKKWIDRVASGSLVETVYIPEKNRGTLCISSQAGCILDCSFCSTGKQGFNSNLTTAEIIGQVWHAVHAFSHGNNQNSSRRYVTNIVMMGMGEPLMNFDNVLPAMDLMMDDLAYGLSKRRVTLSTSGVVPGIHKMTGRTDVSLAISLHAATNDLRNTLVPINRKYPLEQLLDAVHCYMSSLPDKKRVVTIEYTLIKGVNDQLLHAQQLITLLKNTPCKINLIPFNPFPHSGYEKPSGNAIYFFQKQLLNAGFNVTVRKTRGDDIDAACGQLVGMVSDKTKRNTRYLQKAAQSDIQPVKIVG
ncbi:MAG: 23S rRNA (adenine(2503)-C(2))-methyltransferase RlmN, partial [Endozoicomonadaceae bacterium]|nr:23S rRNA (adenine(2503)-C(2))-methyltransferase RlmN [Endozoicomonadaceae bacterium]